MNRESYNIKNYTYDLPEEKIAKYPILNRDHSKMLVYDELRNISHYQFSDLPAKLPSNTLLIFNNTKVIYARLLFKKETGAGIEIFCLSPVDPFDYQGNLSSTNTCIWECLVGNLKKWKNEELILNISKPDNIILKARRINVSKGKVLIEFNWNSDHTFAHILHEAGKIPIPPYLQRDAEETDKYRYQTVYSKLEGSVAAPTAGLHFTESVFKRLDDAGHKTLELTLHVGAGTFIPVKSKDFRDHIMHEEQFSVNAEFLNSLIEHKGPVIPVGTTSLRTLESLYWLGIKRITGRSISELGQWEYQDLVQNLSISDAIHALISFLKQNKYDSLISKTGIMITPGYRFRMADALITNFHQPGSTLLLLIAAFIGEDWRKVYNYALENKFRFLSYGDSSLLFNQVNG